MKKRKFLAIALAGLLMFSLAACSGEDDPENVKSPDAQNAVSDDAAHYVEGTLHKVNVTESSRPFVVNKMTQYKIIAAADTDISKAANYISGQVSMATGVNLPIEIGSAVWSSTAKYIVIGVDSMFHAAGLTMPSDNIGTTGYYIKTAGNSAFIQANGPNGYHLGALAFLREVIGYDMFADDTVCYEKSGETLPDMEIIERPDFDYRRYGNMLSANGRYGMGYTDLGNPFMTVGSQWCHNSYQFLPPEDYFTLEEGEGKEYHPDWYTPLAYGESSQMRSDLHKGQLCYTAHGNEAELALMKETLYAKLKEVVDDNPQYENITITQQDNHNVCDCASCTAVKNRYGAISATILLFVNDIDDMLQEALEKEAKASGTPKREVYISFFAYHATIDSPTVKNADGTYSAVEGIHTNEHVGVFCAPIEAKFSHSMYEPVNTQYANIIKSWAAVTDHLYMWLYETNYGYFFYPLNSWDISAENLRFCKDNGASFIYYQGQGAQGAVTHFSRLKEYLDSKLEFNVNLNHNDLVDKFFKYYFGEAAVPMRTFFDELQAHMRYLEAAYPEQLTGYIRDPLERSEYWPKRMIDGWMGLINEGYAAIADLAITNPTRYNVLSTHLKLESIFPRYVLCTMYDNLYPTSELYAMRKSFKEDCDSLNIHYFKEHEEGLLDPVYAAWGV